MFLYDIWIWFSWKKNLNLIFSSKGFHCTIIFYVLFFFPISEDVWSEGTLFELQIKFYSFLFIFSGISFEIFSFSHTHEQIAYDMCMNMKLNVIPYLLWSLLKLDVICECVRGVIIIKEIKTGRGNSFSGLIKLKIIIIIKIICGFNEIQHEHEVSWELVEWKTVNWVEQFANNWWLSGI